MSTENFWGELPEPDDASPPVQLLQEQAAYLEKATNGELLGEVEQLPNRASTVRYNLNVVVPSMQDYRYTIVEVEYRPTMHYPVEIWDAVQGALTPDKAENEEDYRQKLRKLLDSPDTKRVIAMLRRQAREQPERIENA